MTIAARLGLGAGLIGRASGVGASRRMSDAEAFATVAIAADAGLAVIDMPSGRPDGERVVGEVLSSTSPLRIVLKTSAQMEAADALEHGAKASLQRLGRERAHALVIHNPSALLGMHGKAIWDRARELKDAGLFDVIGISACVCDDPLGLARRFKPDLMQLPASLLDQRLIVDGVLGEIAALGVAIHLRSVFMQGLLFLASHDLPPDVAELTPGLSRIRLALAEAGADPLQAALAFALSREEVSTVILGVTSPSELRAALAAAAAPAPPLDWSALALNAACRKDFRSCLAA
jgi:aryl-alcohol dehydrogenase-like predicted oxidoreductase